MKHFALLSYIFFSALSSLAMDALIDEFRANLITLAHDRKESYCSSRYARETVEKTIRFNEMLIKAEIEDGGGIILSYFDINEILVGVMAIRFPGNDFWYSFKFPKKDLIVDYNWMFQVHNHQKVMLSPEVNWDRLLFIEIQDNLYHMAKQCKILQVQELFLQINSSNAPTWLKRLEMLHAL